MQTELCLNIPNTNGAVVSVKDWRAKMAIHGDGVLPPWLFGRAEDGTRSDEFPRVRFLGGKRALRIVAFGEDASGRLISLVPDLFKIAVKAAGDTVPFRINEYRVEAAYSPYDRLYHVATPMLTRRSDRWKYYMDDADPQARAAKIRQRIVRGLHRQADFFGLDFPADDEIELVECGGFRAKRIHEATAAGVQYALIAMPVELKGVWQVGSLLSHGHGAVSSYRRANGERVAA